MIPGGRVLAGTRVPSLGADRLAGLCRRVGQREAVRLSTAVAPWCVCAGQPGLQPGCRGPPPRPQAPPGSGWPERCGAEGDLREPGRPPPAAPGRENKSPPSGGGGGCEQKSPLAGPGRQAAPPQCGDGWAPAREGHGAAPAAPRSWLAELHAAARHAGGGRLGHSRVEAIHLRHLPGPALVCPRAGLWAGLNVGGEGVPGPLSPRPTGSLPGAAAQPARLLLFLVLVRGCSWPSPGCSLGPGLSSRVGLSLGPPVAPATGGSCSGEEAKGLPVRVCAGRGAARLGWGGRPGVTGASM